MSLKNWKNIIFKATALHFLVLPHTESHYASKVVSRGPNLKAKSVYSVLSLTHPGIPSWVKEINKANKQTSSSGVGPQLVLFTCWCQKWEQRFWKLVISSSFGAKYEILMRRKMCISRDAWRDIISGIELKVLPSSFVISWNMTCLPTRNITQKIYLHLVSIFLFNRNVESLLTFFLYMVTCPFVHLGAKTFFVACQCRNLKNSYYVGKMCAG